MQRKPKWATHSVFRVQNRDAETEDGPTEPGTNTSPSAEATSTTPPPAYIRARAPLDVDSEPPPGLSQYPQGHPPKQPFVPHFEPAEPIGGPTRQPFNHSTAQYWEWPDRPEQQQMDQETASTHKDEGAPKAQHWFDAAVVEARHHNILAGRNAASTPSRQRPLSAGQTTSKRRNPMYVPAALGEQLDANVLTLPGTSSTTQRLCSGARNLWRRTRTQR